MPPPLPDHVAANSTMTAMRELYALVPEVNCRGLCASFCVPVYMSHAEAAVVNAHASDASRRAGPCSALGVPRCPKLSAQGRCTVYEHRPMVCRLWGAASQFECPHGCRPAGDRLTAQQCLELLLQSLQLGGTDLLDDRGFTDIRACLDVPGLAEAIMGYLRGNRDSTARLGPLLRRAKHAVRQRDARELALTQTTPSVQVALKAVRDQLGEH